MLQCNFKSEFSLFLTLSITQLHGQSDSRTCLHPRHAEMWGWACWSFGRKGGGGTRWGCIGSDSLMHPGSPAWLSGSWEMDPQIKVDTADFPSPAASQDVPTSSDSNRHWMESRRPTCQGEWADIGPIVDKYHFLRTFDCVVHIQICSLWEKMSDFLPVCASQNIPVFEKPWNKL